MAGLPPIPSSGSTLPPIPTGGDLPPIPGTNTPTPQAPGAYTPILNQKAISDMWVKNGGDKSVADLMGHIAYEESAGHNDAHNAYKDDKGIEHKVQGLFQISDVHGQGNYADPIVNIRKAIDLYNARVAKGGTGLEDWLDSKDKGATGGWGKYLTPPIQIKHQDAKTGPNHTPLPPGAAPYTNKPKNEDPRLGNYNIAESLAGHQELPFMAFNAWVMDGGKEGKHFQDMLDLWKPKAAGGKGSPGAASALYGLNSPTVLDSYSKSNNPALKAYAAALNANKDWLPGAATFMEEWFNPMAWAEGKAVGKLAAPVIGTIGKIPGAQAMFDKLAHIMSSYKGIVAEHGEGPRNHLAAVGQRMSAAQEEGHNQMMDVFGGLSGPEHVEVVRRQQGLEPNTTLNASGRGALIDKAADMKRDLTRALTAEKLATGSLRKTQISGVPGSKPTDLYHNGKKVGSFDFDPGTYHGLAGQYNHPAPKFNELLEQIGMKRSSTGAASLKEKTYKNIDEAMADHASGAQLKDGIDHADIFRNFMMTGNMRNEFETGIRQLAQKYPDMITSSDKFDREKSKALTDSGKYIPLLSTGINDNASPFLKNAHVSKSFYDFLNDKNSMSMILGKSLAERGGATGAAKWVNGFNQAYRNMIIANPGYHPFWNIAPNASAAAADRGGLGALNPLNAPKDLANLMANHTRAMLGVGATVSHAMGLVPGVGAIAKPITRTLDATRHGIEHQFLKNADSFQDAMHTALQAGADADTAARFGRSAAEDEARYYGAQAEFGAPKTALGGTAKVFTRDGAGKFAPKWDDPKTFFDSALTRLGNWNKEGTFGERGEQGFATTLFHQLSGKGGIMEGDHYGAAWAVREALGNYRNINPENLVSKYIMFFPWLASNVPFWFKQLAKSPTFITAPTQASRTQRENAGDPTAYDAANPHMGLSIYNPSDSSHREIPLPMKDAEKIAQSGYDMVSNHFSRGLGEGLGEVESRLKPLYGAGSNLFATQVDEKANPVDSFHGYTTMFDKNMPHQAAMQALTSTVGQVAPLPVPFVAHDILNKGYDPAQLGNYIQEAAGLGYINTPEADSLKKLDAKADQMLEREMTRLRHLQNIPNSINEDAFDRRQEQIMAQYNRMKAQVKMRVDAAKGKGSSSLPPIPSTLPPIPH